MSTTTKLKKRCQVKKYLRVYVNRNIFGCLVLFAVKHEETTNINKPLQYPLLPVPLSVATVNGSERHQENRFITDYKR